MTGLAKTVSIIYATSLICNLISHLLKAASKSCKREKKESRAIKRRQTSGGKKKTDIPL